ncbi:MAG: DUF6782 family putative metallopeptidase [Polyangiales bacterium]
MALFSACANEETGGCPTLEVCDVRSASCQKHALTVAACLRDVDLPAAPIETVVLEPTAYTEAFVGEIDPEHAQLEPAEVALRRALALFSVSSPPVDRRSDWTAQATGTIGFYDRETNRITLRGDQVKSGNGENAILLLVHEMTHALQAAEGAFTPRPEIDNADASLARRAITEGDARLTEMRAYVPMVGRTDENVSWLGWFANMAAAYAALARESSDLYRDRAMLFPYLHGAKFLRSIYESEGMPGVLSLVRGPSPLTTRQILDQSEGGAALQPGPRARDLLVASLPEPWKLSSVSHFGAWFVRQTLERRNLHLSASEVVRDALTVHAAPAAGSTAPALAVFWRIELTSESGARTLAESARRLGGFASHEGSTLVLAAVTDPEMGSPPTPTWVAQTQPDLYFEPEAAAAPRHHACAHPRAVHGSR